MRWNISPLEYIHSDYLQNDWYFSSITSTGRGVFFSLAVFSSISYHLFFPTLTRAIPFGSVSCTRQKKSSIHHSQDVLINFWLYSCFLSLASTIQITRNARTNSCCPISMATRKTRVECHAYTFIIRTYVVYYAEHTIFSFALNFSRQLG